MENENPFESPALEATAYSRHEPGGSLIRSVFAVLLGGVLVDYFGTELIRHFVVWVLQLTTGSWNTLTMVQSMPIRVALMICGVLCSFFGGMLAAWIARRKQVLHAFLSVTVAHVLVLFQIIFIGGMNFWITLVMSSICFVAAVFAGKILTPSNPLPEEV